MNWKKQRVGQVMVVVASAGGKGIIWYIRTYQHDLYLLVVVVYNVDIYILVDQINTQQRRGMYTFWSKFWQELIQLNAFITEFGRISKILFLLNLFCGEY